MPQVLLVNPSPRKGKSKMATRKKARSPAQRAATAKLVRANKARASGAKRKSPTRRKARSVAAPTRRRARRSVAPKRSPARRKYRRSSSTAASSAGRTLRYRRPNPIGDFVGSTLIPSAVGGAGALALDVAIAMLPLPPAMKAGPMAPLVRVAGAVGLGMIAGKVAGRRVGEQVAAGALTVTLYNAARAALVRVSGGKIPGLSMYPEGVGDYVSEADMEALGYTGSAEQIGEYVGDESMSGYETGVYR